MRGFGHTWPNIGSAPEFKPFTYKFCPTPTNQIQTTNKCSKYQNRHDPPHFIC